MNGLTIITPSFRSARYLRECLQSVSACGCVVRHIVADGGSDDGTVELLRTHAREDKRLLWWCRKDNGQADALNQALAQVQTEYFGWLNADDLYKASAVDAAFRLLARSTAAERPAILYGDYALINAGGEQVAYRRQPSFRYADCLYSYLTVMNSSALFHTGQARACGGFDEELQFAMDYDLVLRMAQRGAVRYFGHCLSAFRRHDEAKTATLQDVYRREISAIRARYATVPEALQPLVQTLSRARVVARMAREGCLLPRIQERWTGRPAIAWRA